MAAPPPLLPARGRAANQSGAWHATPRRAPLTSRAGCRALETDERKDVVGAHVTPRGTARLA